MRRLYGFLLLLLPAMAAADNGTVLLIDKLAPKNAAFIGIVDSSQTLNNTTNFNNNLSTADTTVQEALDTLDDLTGFGGSGGASTLAVKYNGTIVSSPTSVINFTSPIIATLVSGTTVAVTVDTTTLATLLNIAGLTAYGSLYSSSQSISVSLSTTPTKLGIFKSTGNYANVTASTSAATITISTTGAYYVFGNIISTGTGVADFRFDLRVNNLTTGFGCPDTPSARCVMAGVVRLSSGDVVSMFGYSGSGTPTMYATDTQLSVHIIGGTSIGSGGGASGDITSVTAGTGLTGGGTSGDVSLALDPTSTYFIQNTNSLQSGATFFVSSGTVGGQFIIRDPENASLVFSPGSSSSIIVLDNQQLSAPYSQLTGRYRGDDISYARTTNANNGTYAVFLSSTNGSTPTVRYSISRISGAHQFANSTGTAIIEFNPVGNSSFTIPIYASSGTINGQLTVNSIRFPDGTIQVTSAPVVSAGGGGGSSVLEVFSKFDGTRSSPTASIGFSEAFRGTVSGSTFTAQINPSSVSVLTNGLVANAQIDGSSITKQGLLIAGSNITLTTGTSSLTIAATSGGSGSSIYSATTTASFPFGFSVSTISFSSPYAVKSIFLNAGSGLCQTNNGCVSPAQYETITSSIDYIAATFQAGTTQYWQTNFTLPRNYVTASTFTVNFVWTTTMSIVTSSWKVDMVSVANTGAIDTAWGTAVSLSTASTTTGALNISQDSGAITAGGSPDINKELYVRVYRNGDATGDVRFLGMRLYYLYNKLSEN